MRFFFWALLIAGMTTGAVAEGPTRGDRLVGRVVAIDGDTLAGTSGAVAGLRLRLEAVDAPEMGSDCVSPAAGTTCGIAAAAALGQLVAGSTLVWTVRNRDRWGRLVVTAQLPDGTDLGAALVATGWAVLWERYGGARYQDQQAEARRALRGVWALSAEQRAELGR